MPVLPFAPFRFTPDDLARFRAKAEPMTDLGFWQKWERYTSPQCDEIFIWRRGRIPPSYCVARLEQGQYCLEFNNGLRWVPLIEAATLLDCLPRSLFRSLLTHQEHEARIFQP